MNTSAQLDRLNELLMIEGKALGLPPYRKEVTRSGSNLAWLKKVLTKNPDVSDELKGLVQKTIHQLTR